MTDYFIPEDGIPHPEHRDAITGKTAWLRSMKIDQCCLIPAPDKSLYGVARHLGYKIMMRRQPDGTVRVWRIS